MNKRLLKVAAYLSSQGLFAEAAQLKKVAGKMSDFNPYAQPKYYGRVTPPEDSPDEYFVQVPGNITVEETKVVKSRIEDACKNLRFSTATCKVSRLDTKVIGEEEVHGFKVTISGVSENMDTQTPLERLVESLGGFEAGFEVHNLKAL